MGPSGTPIVRDAYALIMNGNGDIRDFSIEVSKSYIEDSSSKEYSYKMKVLIICVVCIVITLIASGILIPVTYSLDTEQEDIVKKWLHVSSESKALLLKNINEF